MQVMSAGGSFSGVKLSWPKIVIQCAGMNRHAAERGDSHYGKDFIELQRHCEGKSCVCVADFKLSSSTENAKEFADYVVAAFGKKRSFRFSVRVPSSMESN